MADEIYLWCYISFNYEVITFINLLNFRRNFGIYLIATLTILYFAGITCLSVLHMNNERF